MIKFQSHNLTNKFIKHATIRERYIISRNISYVNGSHTRTLIQNNKLKLFEGNLTENGLS